MSLLAEESNPEELDFKWGKKRGVGGKKKEVQFYESFTYDGMDYSLYDCVYMHREGEPKPYIGKLIKIWENRDTSKKVKVHWFFQPSEISYWLGDEQTLENEIFLASGEGIGLANVNPLEVIGGKCNVLCISKDVRNPQPCIEELQMADYVFYRVFDVGNCTISDKMDDKIGGIEVKFMFNRKERENATANVNGVACTEMLLPQNQNPSAELETLKAAQKYSQLASNEDVDVKKVNHDKGKSEVASKEEVDPEKVDQDKGKSEVGKVSGNQVEIDEEVGKISGNRVEIDEEVCKISRNQVEFDGGVSEVSVNQVEVDKEVSKASGNQLEVDEKVPLSEDNDGLAGRPSKKARLDSSVKLTDKKNNNSIQKSSHTENRSEEVSTSGEKTKTAQGKNSFAMEKKVKSAQDSGALEGRPSKKMKVENPAESVEDTSRKIGKLSSKSDGNVAKNVATSVTSSEGKTKPKIKKESLGLEKSPTMKKADEKIKKVFDKKLSDVSSGATIDRDKKIGEIFEVAPRPNVDSSKWFRALPWEERMQSAHEKGRLVLLQNLNPEYTSGDVEDIIWNVFNENCTAKMIQRTAISSQHAGQAFVIFQSRDAAERVVKRLEDECLMLSDKRPLVGCIGTLPSSSGKQSTFVGHLLIDKIKHQMQREMKEAVSTSHCSQPNTLEYEMAMEWCLLQTRSDNWWKQLYQKHGDELTKLKAKLKSK